MSLNKPVVDWIGNLSHPSGYGQHMRGIVFNFPKNQLDLSLVDENNTRSVGFSDKEKSYINNHSKGRRNDPLQGKTDVIEVWHLNPWSVAHFASSDPNTFHCDDVYKICNTVYESPEIPSEWVGLCDKFDEIWCPSKHAKNAFKNSKIDSDIHFEVFREGVDSQFYLECDDQLFDYDEFTFISLFDFTYRKGWDRLFEAYCNEFTEDDPVNLVIKTNYGGGSDEEKRIVERQIKKVVSQCPNNPDFEIVWDWIPEEKLPKFYSSGDAFVLPTRGEGFGLPIFESASCGLPVITTDYFAPTEYLDDKTYWIDINGMESYPYNEAMKHEPNCSGLPFADPSVSSICNQMRKVFEQDDPVSPNVGNLDWKTPAKNCVNRLKEIWNDK